MSYMVKLGQLESLGCLFFGVFFIDLTICYLATVGFRFFPAIIDDKERNKLDLVVPDER